MSHEVWSGVIVRSPAQVKSSPEQDPCAVPLGLMHKIYVLANLSFLRIWFNSRTIELARIQMVHHLLKLASLSWFEQASFTYTCWSVKVPMMSLKHLRDS